MRISTLFLATAALFSAGVASAQTPAYTLNPKAGAATDLQNITITFKTDTVMFYENNRMPVAVLENTSTGAVYTCDDPTRNTRTTAAAEYTFTFADQDAVIDAEDPESTNIPAAINVPGNYSLTINAMYTSKGDVKPITVNYTIEYPVAYTLNPAAGVADELEEIILTFPTEEVFFYDINRMPSVVLENTTTGAIYTAEPVALPNYINSKSAYKFNFVAEGEEEPVAEITEPGDYLLSVKAMYVGDYEDLPVLQVKYTIEYPVAYTLDPAAGEVESLSEITLTFADNSVNFYENSRPAPVVVENLTTGDFYNGVVTLKGNTANSVTFSVQLQDEDGEDLVLTTPGSYRLAIRSIYYQVKKNQIDLPVITVDYTIPYPTPYTLTPSNGSVVEDLTKVTLTFDEEFVSFYENNPMPVAVLENKSTGAIYVCSEPERNTKAEAAAEYILTFVPEDYESVDDPDATTTPDPVTAIGDYVLTIRAMYTGSLEEETAEDLPVIVASYTIPYPYDYILDPANGATVGEITSITIEFPNNKNIAFLDNSRNPVAVITNGLEGDDEVVYSCAEADRDTFAMSEGVVYNFFFQDEKDQVVAISEPGWWYLTIRGLVLEADPEVKDATDEVLPIISAAYYVSDDTTKVTKIEAVDGMFNVYSINGVQVVRNGNAASLNNLPAGLYVINGQKVLIRK